MLLWIIGFGGRGFWLCVCFGEEWFWWWIDDCRDMGSVLLFGWGYGYGLYGWYFGLCV